MKLHDIEFLKLLPIFMRGGEAVQGLAKGIEIVVKKFDGSIKKLSTWDSIENLSEEELDELAWELNVFWYDKKAPINIKRTFIKDADLVHSKLGTKWAVEKIITEYFGSGKMMEYWEYAGKPFHFKILSGNPAITNQRLLEFMSLLEKMKRQSCILDSIMITLTGQMHLKLGSGMHEIGHDIVLPGLTLLTGKTYPYIGSGIHEVGHETHFPGKIKGRMNIHAGIAIHETGHEIQYIKEETD